MKLTDEELTRWLHITLDDDRQDEITQIRPVTLRRMVNELRALRLSPDEREALKTARMVLEADFEATKARYPKGTPMNPHIPQALAVLDRLIGGAK